MTSETPPKIVPWDGNVCTVVAIINDMLAEAQEKVRFTCAPKDGSYAAIINIQREPS